MYLHLDSKYLSYPDSGPSQLQGLWRYRFHLRLWSRATASNSDDYEEGRAGSCDLESESYARSGSHQVVGFDLWASSMD